MGNKKQAYLLKSDFKHLRKLISTVALTNKNKENDVNPSIVSYQGDLYFFSENAIDNLNEAGVLKLWFEQLKINNKEETIEEAAEKYGNSIGNKNGTAQFDFIRGAKWQQERMHSDEDMTNYALYILHNNVITPKEWFEQFKNK